MQPAWIGFYGLPLPAGRREALFIDGVAIFRKWPLGWQRKKRPKRRGKTDKQNNNTDKENNKKLPKNLQMSEKIAIFVVYLRINNH